MGRKRQRSRAALTDDDEEPQAASNVAHADESESAQDRSSRSYAGDDELVEERKREADVWDAFAEEHHEVLEQLPLSLHRQLKLVRELDSQSDALQADLLASIRQYVRLRESLAAQDSLETHLVARDVNSADVDPHGGTSLQGDSSRINDDLAHTSVAYQPKPGETTRTLLQHIALTSEEAIRAAEEKVSIAQTAFETVDRHIRLLDQAIKEQEAAISLGVRPGTHLAPILLPDLVVPRWARPSRVEHSPVPSLSPEPELHTEEPPPPEPPALLAPPSPKVPKKGKKAVAPKPTKPEKEEIRPPAVGAGGEEHAMTPRTRRTSVRLTLPAQPLTSGPSVPADPSETRYCYCNQVSFGTMIACDGEGCKLEWFHLGCTGLSEVPGQETNWYCRECKHRMTQKGRVRT